MMCAGMLFLKVLFLRCVLQGWCFNNNSVSIADSKDVCIAHSCQETICVHNDGLSGLDEMNDSVSCDDEDARCRPKL